MIAFVAIEAGWRAWRRTPPDTAAARLEAVLLLVLGVTIAGGLGLLVGGARPREPLHIVYAVIALVALPLAGSLSRRAAARPRAAASMAAALVALVVLARLFGTG